MSRARRAALLFKRLFDVVAAVASLVVLSPLIVAVALVVRVTLGSPVLFRQRRLGLEGREFELLKFRTMTDQRGPSGELLPDEMRLTTVGRRLRALSLDELPELINVLRGDMSVVGPRPLLPEYRNLYTPEQWRRHEVRPGLAGPVVARGRNSLSWEQKFALDVAYVDNWSLLEDLRLLALSALSALRRHGVSADGHATMPRFGGERAR